MKKYIQPTILQWIFTGVLFFQAASAQTLPISASKELVALRELKDYNLVASLEKNVKQNPKWAQLIATKKLAIGLVGLSNLNNIRFATINGNEMMYAASLPKIAVLLAAMDAIESGELQETQEVKTDMK